MLNLEFKNREQLEKFMNEEILNTTDVTQMLGCSRQYLFKLVKMGKLNPIKVMQKDKLFLKSDIEKWLENK